MVFKLMLPLVLIGLAPGNTSLGAKPPRFYFEVRGVTIPPGSVAGLKDKAKAALISELKNQPTMARKTTMTT